MEEKAIQTIVKKTVYIEKELEKQIKIQAILQEKTESNLLNEILGLHFNSTDEEP